jgi:hypothetical protein
MGLIGLMEERRVGEPATAQKTADILRRWPGWVPDGLL